MMPVRPDPQAPRSLDDLGDYWDARRSREGKLDRSRCAADLRQALAHDHRRVSFATLLIVSVALWVTAWTGIRIYASRHVEPPATVQCLCPDRP